MLQKCISKVHAQRGRINTGMLYIIVIMFILIGIAYLATGPTPTQTGIQTGYEVQKNDSKPEQPKDRLQLYTFGGVTITPPANGLCVNGGANARPDIIAYVYPPHAQAVPSTAQIKIWVNDDKPPKIATGEIITRNSGSLVKEGDRTAKAPDGYLLEPALYVFPQTADAGGQPFFPTNIRGDYDNGGPKIAFGIEPMPANIVLKYHYTAEYIWNIKDLGLRAGEYQLQFVVMDGTDKHGITCINLRVYDPQDKRWAIPD